MLSLYFFAHMKPCILTFLLLLLMKRLLYPARIALGVRLPLVSSKDLLYDIFVFVTNIEIAIFTDDVLLTPHS